MYLISDSIFNLKNVINSYNHNSDVSYTRHRYNKHFKFVLIFVSYKISYFSVPNICRKKILNLKIVYTIYFKYLNLIYDFSSSIIFCLTEAEELLHLHRRDWPILYYSH